MVRLVVKNTYFKIVGDLPESVHFAISDKLCYRIPDYIYTKAYKDSAKKNPGSPWDGYVRLYRPGQLIYTGLLSYVRDVLKKCNIPYALKDIRLGHEQNFPDLVCDPPKKFVDRDYQEFTIDRCCRFSRGIMSMATGSGKTFLVAKLIGKIKVRPFCYYVLSKDLMYQAEETLGECLHTKIGLVGDSHCDIRDVNVCLAQTAISCLNRNNEDFDPSQYSYDSDDVWDESSIFTGGKAEDVTNLIRTCRGLYIDECHHAPAQMCKDVIDSSEYAYWRFGGSATPRREDGQDIIIQALFGRKIVDIRASYLIKRGFLVPLRAYFVPVETYVGDLDTYKEMYTRAIVENYSYNMEVAKTVEILSLLGKSNLILVYEKRHGRMLNEMIPGSVLLTGEDDSTYRKTVLNDMRAGRLQNLVATSLADEGLDIERLDAVHMASSGSSVSRIPQRAGRAIRSFPGKIYGIVIYYHHMIKNLLEQGRKAKRILQEEPEFDITTVNNMEELRRALVMSENKSRSLFEL